MRWLALLFPLGLAAALVASASESTAAAALGRALCVGSLVPALLSLRRPLSRAERSWFVLLAMVALGHAAAAALVYDRAILLTRPNGVIVSDLGRQVLLCAIAALLAIQLRHRGVRRVVFGALGLVALAAGAEILYAYAAFGDVWAAFVRPADFKFFAAKSLHLNVNPLSFTVALTAVLAVPVWWRSRFRALLVAGAAIAIVLSGSRSTQVSVAAGALAYAVLPWIERVRRGTRRAVAALAISAGIALAPFLPDTRAVPRLDAQELSRVTTGRLDLWSAAAWRFAERPWAGWGAQSSRFGIARFLPGYGMDDEVRRGGYHSMYLGVLADKGLLGFVPSMLLVVVLLRWSVALRRDEVHLDGADAAYARLAPVVVFVLATRGVAENAGFMGDANGVVDFVAYAFAAAVVALRAELETEHAVRPGPTCPGREGEPCPDPG